MVCIHPTHLQLGKDTQTPNFQSECWMLASGSAAGMDLLNPASWDTSSCEHHAADTAEIQSIICHELVHVYHGQLNASPDFSETVGIDWLIEGLAVWVSGQLGEDRRKQVGDLIRFRQVPEKLDLFWTGKARYALSGALVEFLNEQYGRDQIVRIMPLAHKKDVLDILNIDEEHLIRNFISGWHASSAPVDLQSIDDCSGLIRSGLQAHPY